MINERSARDCCSEDPVLIENYQEAVADSSQTWDIHHRRETDEGLSARELKKRGEYWHRPACELIFLTPGAHTILHHLGAKHSKATRKKMSQAQSGEKNPMFGRHHSETTKQKMSRAHSREKHPLFGKHRSATTKRKLSLALSGEKNPTFDTHWYNDGVRSVRAKSCPPGFVAGRARAHRAAQERGWRSRQ